MKTSMPSMDKKFKNCCLYGRIQDDRHMGRSLSIVFSLKKIGSEDENIRLSIPVGEKLRVKNLTKDEKYILELLEQKFGLNDPSLDTAELNQLDLHSDGKELQMLMLPIPAFPAICWSLNVKKLTQFRKNETAIF